MSEVLKQPAVLGAPEVNLKGSRLSSYLPAAISLLGAGALTLLRYKAGPEHFSSDGALMMMALACYLIAAVFYLTNLYAPSTLFEKIGLGSATLGVMLNLASWLVRWIAYREHDVAIWLQEGKPEAEWPWLFRNIPFANLYDLSLAFAFGAGITTLLIAHRKNFRFLGAISLPLAALILILARFIGDDIVGLQPVLDSYWRPIHVGIAALSYGVALVCFATAVVYVGFGLLGLTLCAVFFFSHDRVWAQVEEKCDGRFEVVTGGNTNRNHLGFGDRFRRLVAGIGGEPFEVKK